MHYFDFLQEEGRSDDQLSYLITDWIDKNPIGTKTAWEPYPVSLRIVNWIKVFLHGKFRDQVEQGWLDSLFLQSRWLYKNIEYHILANHYLKNGVALYFAGVYFDGMEEAQLWKRKGLQILQEELDEQFLTDGGHYERSPMYHSICLEDYLDVINLTKGSEQSDTLKIDRIEKRLTNAICFLSDLCHPDGEIPLFNDSAFGISSPPKKIFEYADRVMTINTNFYQNTQSNDGVEILNKFDTGYYAVRKKNDFFIIDSGPVGPDYQPGHAHCDTLSYELSLCGERVIIDSGVYDYENGFRREYSRSTKAHNTVSVDHLDQSEVWGLFRVARRAYPIFTKIALLEDKTIKFESSHDGFKRLKGNVIHERTVNYHENGIWEISDRLNGSGCHLLESFIHFHPDFTLSLKNRQVMIINKRSRRTIAHIEVTKGVDIRAEKGWYYPEFGIEHEIDVIVCSCLKELPVIIEYRIVKDNYGG